MPRLKVDLVNFAGTVEIDGSPQNGQWCQVVFRFNGMNMTELRVSNLKEEDFRKIGEMFLLAANPNLAGFL